MSRLSAVYLLSRRDFVQRAKSRAFLISMLVTVGLVLAVGPLIAYTTRADDPLVIALVAPQPAGLETEIRAGADALGLDVNIEDFADVTAAEHAVDSGKAAVAVADGSMVWHEDPSPRLAAVITGAFTTLDRRAKAADLGLTPEQLSALTTPVHLPDRVLQQPDPEKEPREAAAFIGLMVLYISIIMFGQFVLMGVMEEKQNRVVEVVLSRVRPAQILAGKVIGIGLLGLIQIAALGAAGLFVVNVIDVANVDITAIGYQTFAWILLWYLLGYGLYAVIYGALGATVSRQEDMQGAVMVPVLMIVPAFFFGQIATQAPDALIARIGSLVPVWSPMVMPVRAAVGAVSAWEVAASIALVLASIYGLTLLGGRIYRGAILRLGTRVRLREAWSSSRH